LRGEGGERREERRKWRDGREETDEREGARAREKARLQPPSPHIPRNLAWKSEKSERVKFPK